MYLLVSLSWTLVISRFGLFIDIINETKADYEDTSTDFKKMFLTK